MEPDELQLMNRCYRQHAAKVQAFLMRVAQFVPAGLEVEFTALLLENAALAAWQEREESEGDG